MKTSVFYAIAAAKLAAAHCTFQSIVLDGEDQGQHFAVQTPSNSNNPILDVTSDSLICNGGTATDDQVSVAAGSKITMQWHHNDPATTSGDSDEPIASSHKGPVMVYIASADTKGEGAVWQKIYEDGYTSGTWGVDNFITNKGAIEITLPDLAAGDYWIRPEIIALHEASAVGKAQFYNGCGQIKVTGSGSLSLPATGTDMTKAYSATEAGVNFNIYSTFDSYPIPGPDVWTGADSSDATPASSSKAATSAAASTSKAADVIATSAAATSAAATSAAATSAAATSAAASAPATSAAASAPATSAAAQPATSAAAQPTAAQPTTLVTSKKPASTGSSSSGSVALYGQCGGNGYTGATGCASGTCKVQNDYYSQCVEA
ncbi:hypothetical protein P280DRAFT_469161 [Massarina eburnea CBS 473.64]|uniref:AA9 family lytic polysaccharide monooxygenase n=1 Tax=Massarina eburnea CBS 473.64 TaxID=1395130 RepID=A0A6A6S569_9PLEO|nr:hypothetical protein P280DRAFT_469161 [Massarina eburnea CBS 473.64]